MISKIWKNNSVWAVIAQLVSSGITFVIAPVISKRVGIEAYGYIALAQNVLLYINTVVIAFNYFTERNITVALHRGEKGSAKGFYSSTIAADFILMGVMSVPAIYMIAHLERYLKISEYLQVDVKLLFAFMVCQYFFSLLGSIFDAVAITYNRLDINSKNRVIASIIHVVILLVLLYWFPPHVWYVGLGYFLGSAVYLFIQLSIKKVLLPDLSFSHKQVSFQKIINQVKNGIWVSINNFGNILNDGLDLLITNLMITEHVMGIISIAKLFGNFSYAIVASISSSLRGVLLKSYSEDNTYELEKYLNSAMRITGTVFMLIFGGFIAWGESFLRVWMGQQYQGELYLVTLLAMSASLIPSIVVPLYYVYTLFEKMKIPCVITITMGFINVVAMFVLIKYTNLAGVAVLLTTCVLNTLHIIDAPIYAAFCMHIKAETFYRTILKVLLFDVIYALTAFGVRNYVHPNDGLMILIIQMFILFIIGVGIALILLLSSSERKSLICWLRDDKGN